MSTNEKRASCPICNSTDESHKFDEHVLSSTQLDPKEPLSFIISCQRHYHSPSALSRFLARARAELKEYFPEKKFDILPGRLMLTKNGENNIFLGEAFVATYVVFEVA